MLHTIVGTVIAFLAMSGLGVQRQDPYVAQFFAVSATRHHGDTVVRLAYPNKHNVWVCVIFRRPVEPDYAPRWCFIPSRDATEILTIPRWPPVPATDRWEVMANVQYDEGPQYDLGYLETGWVDVR